MAKPEICGACLHPVVRRWFRVQPNCPECERLLAEGSDEDTPCASPEPKTVSIGFYND